MGRRYRQQFKHHDNLEAWRVAAHASGEAAPWTPVCMNEARAFWRSLSAKTVTAVGVMYGVAIILPKADK